MAYKDPPQPEDYAQPYGPDTNALVQYLIANGMGGLVSDLPSLSPANMDLSFGLAPLGEDIGTTTATNWAQDLIQMTADPMVAAYAGPGAFAPGAFDPTITYNPVDQPGARRLSELAASETGSLESFIARGLLDGQTVSQIRSSINKLLAQYADTPEEEIDPVIREVIAQVPTEMRDDGTGITTEGPNLDYVQSIAEDLNELYQSDPTPGSTAAIYGRDGELITPERNLQYITDADGNQVLVEVEEKPSELAEHYRELGLPLPTEEFTPDYLMGSEWQQARDAYESTYGNPDVRQALVDEEMARRGQIQQASDQYNDMTLPGANPGAVGRRLGRMVGEEPSAYPGAEAVARQLMPYLFPEESGPASGGGGGPGRSRGGVLGGGGGGEMAQLMPPNQVLGGAPPPEPPPDFWNGAPPGGAVGVQGQINSRNAGPGIAAMMQEILGAGGRNLTVPPDQGPGSEQPAYLQWLDQAAGRIPNFGQNPAMGQMQQYLDNGQLEDWAYNQANGLFGGAQPAAGGGGGTTTPLGPPSAAQVQQQANDYWSTPIWQRDVTQMPGAGGAPPEAIPTAETEQAAAAAAAQRQQQITQLLMSSLMGGVQGGMPAAPTAGGAPQQPTTGTTLPPAAPAPIVNQGQAPPPPQGPPTGTTLPPGAPAPAAPPTGIPPPGQGEQAAAQQQMMQYLLQSGVPNWNEPGEHVFPQGDLRYRAEWGPNAVLPSQYSSPGEPMAMIQQILERSAPLSRERQAAYDYLRANRLGGPNDTIDDIGGLFPTLGDRNYSEGGGFPAWLGTGIPGMPGSGTSIPLNQASQDQAANLPENVAERERDADNMARQTVSQIARMFNPDPRDSPNFPVWMNTGYGMGGGAGSSIPVSEAAREQAGNLPENQDTSDTPWFRRPQQAMLRFIMDNAEDIWRSNEQTRRTRRRVDSNTAARAAAENRVYDRGLKQSRQVYNEEYGRNLYRSQQLQRAGITPTTLALAQRNQVLAQAGLRP